MKEELPSPLLLHSIQIPSLPFLPYLPFKRQLGSSFCSPRRASPSPSRSASSLFLFLLFLLSGRGGRCRQLEARRRGAVGPIARLLSAELSTHVRKGAQPCGSCTPSRRWKGTGARD